MYFDVPGTLPGTEGTNYDETLYGYDDMGRSARTKDATGTIRRTSYDAIGRRLASYLGTNDSTFSGGESSGTDNMVKTSEVVIDAGGVGNGLVTKRTSFVEDSTTNKRETSVAYDVRGRAVLTTNPTAPHSLVKRDNLGRATVTGQYSAIGSLTIASDPASVATNRMALSETSYDERGRAWKRTRHKIDPADGSDDDTLLSESWFDKDGQVVKVDGEQLVKTAYDRLGRATHRFVLAEDNDTVYADADDVTGDIVLEESQTVYESSDSGNVVMSVLIQRTHDDKGAGETTGALDTNADADALKVTSTNLEGRAQITATWYDDLDRAIDVVSHGTYGGGTFDRDGLSTPARSDTALRTTYSYWDHGSRKDVTDPRGLAGRSEYDDAGRVIAQIRNYVNGTPTGNTGDDDLYTRYEYTDGLRAKLWVDIDGDDVEDTGDQVTLYIFGTTKGTPTASDISTGHLLRAVVYPDSTNTGTTEANINSSDSDVVSHAYNAQGQPLYTKDQAGNVTEYNYDDSGRGEHKRITTLASGFDGDVRRITQGYDGRGRVETVTQYDNATVGSGSITDELKFTYEGWGLISKLEQDVNSAVGASGSVDDYEIAYTYAKATTGRNTIRRVTQTLPSSAVLTYQYLSSSDRHDNSASRVTRIKHGTTALVAYGYLGVGTLVGTRDLPVTLIHNRYDGSGYDGRLDRFNRVTTDMTYRTTVAVALWDADLTYDRNSNILSVDDQVHVGFDALVTVDDLNRVTNVQEGTLSGGSISTETREQGWVLDQLGSWEDVTLDLNGDGDYADTDEYDDDRIYNDVNELTERDTNDNGTANHSPSYDAVGNLTDEDDVYDYEYDAFGRLKTVNVSAGVIAEYSYNGIGHRIAEHTDTNDSGTVTASDDWWYSINNEGWQSIASFVESDTSPTEEYVHHQAGDGGFGGSSYVDELMLRERDTDADGTLDERLWYCQNWRHDVVAIVDDSGQQVEMVRYSAYGVPFGLPGGDCDSDGDCDAGDTSDSDQIQTWIDASAYDVRGDVDLDGDVDSSDKILAKGNPYTGARGGYETLSQASQNSIGFQGLSLAQWGWWHARTRFWLSRLGSWNARDPLTYVEGLSMYPFSGSMPYTRVDPYGEDGSSSSGGGSGEDEPEQGEGTCLPGAPSPGSGSGIDPDSGRIIGGPTCMDPSCSMETTIMAEIGSVTSTPGTCSIGPSGVTTINNCAWEVQVRFVIVFRDSGNSTWRQADKYKPRDHNDRRVILWWHGYPNKAPVWTGLPGGGYPGNSQPPEQTYNENAACHGVTMIIVSAEGDQGSASIQIDLECGDCLK